MTVDLSPKLAARLEALPAGLRSHTQRSRAIARELAQASGVDPDLADVAAAAHDVARAFPTEELVALARELGLAVDDVEAEVPLLLHGPVAAELLRREGAVTDPEVLDAIRWHSTARPGLSALGKVVFLADKLDPEKGRRSPTARQLHALALRDLDAAVLACLERELARMLREGHLIHPASVEARNELRLKRAGP
ncbi:MAG: bis(5'-nucleosyl)-tetraphosphatase (symmetrical) YqeK [Chloroflexi bacterium]|nr:bis(5'-nucleosyl)-tetraphosphatase (symmetrical) YqeK [Chloroflexota bacterium]